MAKVRPGWGNGKSPCGNDVVGVSASATPSDRRKFWSNLKAGHTGEVRQEPYVSCHQCVISGDFFCFCLFQLALVKKGSEAHKYGFQMPFYFSGSQFLSRF